MKSLVHLTAVAAPFALDNVDTDRIIPSRFLRKSRANGLQQYLFHDLRFNADGTEIADFVLNRAPYRRARMLVAGENFGCGSSREAAVYALVDFGIEVVIAPSFGDIFQGNLLQNGVVPAVLQRASCDVLCRTLEEHPGAELAVDLPAQTVTAPDGTMHAFAIDASAKERLLQGLDDIDLILQELPAIEAFEAAYRERMPWLR